MKIDEDLHPDWGNTVCVKRKNMEWYNLATQEIEVRALCDFEGLSTDVGLLPTYDDLMTGCSFLAIDDGSLRKYEMSTKTWKKME